MVRWIKNEFWNGYSWFERMFLLSMVLLQVIVYCFVPDTPIGMVCGIAGVVCVVLTAKGKISSYIFNFIQMITYMIICWNASLYLEFGEQVFYFVACIFGVILWKKNMTKNEDGSEQVIAKKFKPWHWVVTIIVTIVSTLILGYFGDNILGSTLSYLDAFTVALAIIAQLLMVWRYREQWAIWIAIDVSSLIMFIILGQWSMVAMYIAWTINAFYGWYNWSKLEKANSNE
ncbi:MAG: nicotinamide mononucleotide transporter [Paludibacteraceae bacterium]|nr:nicotinamide mononucleotide transporter [Paludibacteraceae bacterium]